MSVCPLATPTTTTATTTTTTTTTTTAATTKTIVDVSSSPPPTEQQRSVTSTTASNSNHGDFLLDRLKLLHGPGVESSPTLLERVHVFVLNELYTVWDAHEIFTLRSKYRVTGGLVGTLPSAANQNAVLTAPLMLSFEELVLLDSLDCIEVVPITDDALAPDNDAIQHCTDELRAASVLRHRLALLSRKAAEKKYRALAAAESTAALRKRKRDEVAAASPIATASAATTPASAPDASYSASLRECVAWRDSEAALLAAHDAFLASWRTPLAIADAATTTAQPSSSLSSSSSSSSSRESDTCVLVTRSGLRVESRASSRAHCAAFVDLWRRGYWLSSASKFGGHFLAYNGDPLQHHADFIVMVAPPQQAFLLSELAAMGRLANAVKKAGVVAMLDESALARTTTTTATAATLTSTTAKTLIDVSAPNLGVQYLTIQWRNMAK